MEIGKRIRELRNAQGWNQDVFAEKTFVSRQTVSSWENDRSYPDIRSLLLMSELFGLSLDDLIKGDIAEMKEKINGESLSEFRRLSKTYAIGLIIGIIIPYPLVRCFKLWGIIVYVLYFAALIMLACRIEILKKENDIQTYKEITAFIENRELSNNEKIEEKAKRPYQKFLLAAGAGVLTLTVFILMGLIFG